MSTLNDIAVEMKAELGGSYLALKRLAFPSEQARRRHSEIEDWFLDQFDPFVADKVKILQSKALRRSDAKTQVQTGRVNTHVRNRLSHSLEVATTALVISSFLGLNTGLCESAGLGHDMGHAPFGHAGEAFLDRKLWEVRSPNTFNHFRHEVFSVVVAQHIERQGHGMNLTFQVLQAILNHSRGKGSLVGTADVPLECDVVMLADKIAYVFSDWNDIFGRGVLNISDYPELERLMKFCGDTQRRRMWYVISNLCRESAKAGLITFGNCEAGRVFAEIKREMYQIYERVNLFESEQILERILAYIKHVAEDDLNPLLVMALMTDRDLLFLDSERHISRFELRETSIYELIPYLRKLPGLDLTDPDLSW